ncbi:hypothetical protein EIB71_07825 [Kaistella daneshvariae]|uniref:Uncharacterized protein n=1 Tax=Kaistella daneshvariae TaxID=2487074 RepID=A0ABN5T2C8_9FLAO|nr:hypothetical protein [Kaistella daneshvariae]AZI67575.1 hypothetical protein EIB71_07825 [Kaistella daneshvariae]
MKHLKLLALLSLLLTSCVSTKVSSANNYDYKVLKAKSNYIIETNDGKKIQAFQFLQENETSLLGLQNDKEIEIEKNTIEKVSKISAGKTVALVVGGFAVAVIAPAYINNKPVGL